MRRAFKDFALKEEAYRRALAERMTELHADGVAWSACPDLARVTRRWPGFGVSGISRRV